MESRGTMKGTFGGKFMANSNLHFQLNFSKSNDKKIRSLYSVNESQNENKIVLAVWFGKIFGCNLRERGFVFTEKALFWNVNGKFNSIPLVEGESVSCQGSNLVIKNGEISYTFAFPAKVPNDDIELLRTVTSEYFDKFQKDKNFGSFSAKLEELDESKSIFFAALKCYDFFEQGNQAQEDGVSEKSETIEKSEKSDKNENAEKTEIPEKTEKTETTEISESSNKKSEKKSAGNINEKINEKINPFVKSGHFVRHIFDLATDLILILAIVLLLKPELFNSKVKDIENSDEQVQEILQETSEKQVQESSQTDEIPVIELEENEKILIPDEFISNETSPLDSKSASKSALESESTSLESSSSSEASIEEVKKDEVKEAKAELKEAKRQKKAEKNRKRAEFWQNYWRSFVCFAVFIVMKSLIISSSKKSKKAICGIILAVMSVFTICALIPKVGIPFGIYLIILFLLMIALQFAQGFSARVIGRKIIWFVLLGIAGYIFIHASLPDFSENMEKAGEQIKSALSMLNLPVKWW